MKCPLEFGEDKYRTIEEARVTGLLLLHGWAYEVRSGGRAQAERQVRAALDRFVALGLPYRKSANGERLFDPVEAVNFLRWACVQHGDHTLTDHCLPTAHRLVLEAQGNGTRHPPPSPESLGAQRYCVRILRMFNLENRPAQEQLRLRLPRAIEGPELDDVETTFLPPAGLEVDVVSAPARLDALIRCPVQKETTIGLTATFTARPFAPAGTGAILDRAEVELYTRPSEGLIRVSNRIRTLASALTRGQGSTWMMLRQFWNFMLDELSCGAVHYDQLAPEQPLDWVLDHGWYDCQLGSALLCALCRARGIPARLVSGYFLHPAAPASHSWSEVWCDATGWTPFDLFCWDLSLGGRDADWRDYYFGHLDHRLIVERPPLLFNGTGSVRLPPAWHRLVAPEGPGSAIEFRALDTGALVYREYVEIKRADDVTRRPAE